MSEQPINQQPQPIGIDGRLKLIETAIPEISNDIKFLAKKFDTNGDGKISRNEFVSGLKEYSMITIPLLANIISWVIQIAFMGVDTNTLNVLINLGVGIIPIFTIGWVKKVSQEREDEKTIKIKDQQELLNESFRKQVQLEQENKRLQLLLEDKTYSHLNPYSTNK